MNNLIQIKQEYGDRETKQLNRKVHQIAPTFSLYLPVYLLLSI